MQLFKSIFYTAVFAIALAGCNNVDFKKTKSGLAYKLFPSSSGTKAVPGAFLKVNVIYKVRDSVLQSTYGAAPTYLPVPDSTRPSRPYDITEIAHLLKKGDSVYLVQEIDTLFKGAPPEQMPPFFKKGDKLYTGVKVLDVLPNEQAVQADYEKEQAIASVGQLKKDDKIITDYLAKNNIKAVKAPQGTYVEIISQGSGPLIDTSVSVQVFYRGKTLAGKEFDSNMDTTSGRPKTPLLVAMVPDPSRGLTVIKGWNDGLTLLSKGAKARFYIPSSLAYGPQAQGPIGANEILIFDIEVADVLTRDKATAENEKARKQMMAQQEAMMREQQQAQGQQPQPDNSAK
jgi:FKBP-type peptidyl-prolyl cis-trans isomerase